MHHKRVAIIGGGLAGLEVAARLQEHTGIETHIFEPGHQARAAHIGWDVRHHAGDEPTLWPLQQTGWSQGGLPSRLGGRTLCYTATFGPIEAETLHRSWPSGWAERLPRLCDAVLRDMEGQYPEMHPEQTGRKLTTFAKGLGLSPVPQAAVTDLVGNRFRAHTMLDRVKSDEHTQIIQQRVLRLKPARKNRWSVVCHDSSDTFNTVTHDDYDACVLAASAIGNLIIVAHSLNTEVTSRISDHHLVGAVMAAPNTDKTRLTASVHHPKLWSGAKSDGELRAKLYMCDLPVEVGANYRPVDAGYEISAERDMYSAIVCRPGPSGNTDLTIISPDGLFLPDRMERVEQSLQRVATSICDTAMLRTVKASNYPQALEILQRCDNPVGTVVRYEYPYGSEEHEACTHPIGGDGLTGISEDLELFNMPGVFTAGPGNFPSLGLSGPSLATIAMSRWLADNLGRRLLS